MATTAWAAAEGLFEDGDGHRQLARAELSLKGLAVVAADGAEIALWKPPHLARAMGADGFRISARSQSGVFITDPDLGRDLIRALASIPNADAPMMPRALVWTMVLIVGMALASLFALVWGFSWFVEWLTASG